MTENAPPPSKRRKRWPRILAAVVLAVGVAAVLGWSFREAVLERTAKTVLHLLDFGGGAAFRVAEVGIDRLRAVDVSMGPDGPAAKAIEVRFKADELASGRIRSLRLIEPEFLLRPNADGALVLAGLPPSFGAGSGDAGGAQKAFPALPDIDRVEIAAGRVRLEIGDVHAVGLIDATIVRNGADALTAAFSLVMADPNGRQASLNATGLEIAYGAKEITFAGPVTLTMADAMADAEARSTLWIDGGAKPSGAATVDALLALTTGRFADQSAFAEARGAVRIDIVPDAPPRAHADLQFRDFRLPTALLDHMTVAVDADGATGDILLDAVGPNGYLAIAMSAPEGIGPIAIETRGEIDLPAVLPLFSPIEATGRARFVATSNIDLESMLAEPHPRYIASDVELIVEAPTLAVPGIVESGSAFGQIDLAIAGGAATITSPGFTVGGVNLPPALLASLPVDIRRALSEPAFIRMGGPGLVDTVYTLSLRDEGGFAAVGRLGVGVSNPNLALFFEGDAVIRGDAEGKVEHIESDQLTVRIVDAELGPARVGGRAELNGLTGSGERFEADAAIQLAAHVDNDSFTVERAEFEMRGPLSVTPEIAVFRPSPGGAIYVNDYDGPQFSLPAPIRLTLTADGARRIAYDRAADDLAADLQFRGFKTKARVHALEAGAQDVELALETFGFTLSRTGAAFSLTGASARLPAYQLALDGADARIAFGGEETQSGSLRIASIRHLAEPAFTRPLSLRADVKGKGNLLTFDGALIAAGDRARLTVAGSHHVKTGHGDARFRLAPVVFAPGVLQPHDFAPALHLVLLETIGEIGAEADIAWNPSGLIRQSGAVSLSIDKVRTSEVTVEGVSSEFKLDNLFPPSTDGLQRIRIGAADVGVPLKSGAVEVDIVSPDQIVLEIGEFGLFGGLIRSQRMTLDPTNPAFETALEVEGIDLASILAFAEFGELQATGKLEGRIPLVYADGELRIRDGLLKTGAGGGSLRYKPKAIDDALIEVDRSAELALKAISNFAYDEISINIDETAGEELRLVITINGRSVDLFEGVPFLFNIVIEGPIRQLIQDNLEPLQLPDDVQGMVDRGEATVDQAPAPAEPVQ